MGRSKAERIRQMHDAGYSTAEIARSLGIRYQHAYNVVSAHLQRREAHARTVAQTTARQIAAAKAMDKGVRPDAVRSIISRMLGL